MTLLLTLGVLLVAARVSSDGATEHLTGVLRLPGLVTTLVLSLIAPLLTFRVVHATKEAFLAKGFGGRDLLKLSEDRIPESLGLPTSIVYCMLMCAYIPFRYGMRNTFTQQLASGNADGGWSGDMQGTSGFPHHEVSGSHTPLPRLHADFCLNIQLSSYLSSLLSIFSSIMLGFLDDVFDIRWRLKMPIPILASLPMLVVYQAGQGGTSVVVPGWPAFLRQFFQANIINLGPLYHLFIMLLSTFCVHSINILAGINGVEVGQALIIALSLCCNDIIYLDPRAGQPGSFASVELRDRHVFSLALLLPFCGCCIGLLAWNRYPARVFVGDTFCYFAGQVIACAGVLGHFSKTLLLFFVPQLFNFALSLPQLFGLVPCPRHRVPRWV
jgi:UDP-N-acetylglucosamine--dolichyl-phosphate N-acetylglucosaminephosphotransferase